MNFNSKIKLIGDYFATPLFDDRLFSASDYRRAYDMYHLARSALNMQEWDLVDDAIIEHVQTQRMVNQFHHLNYFREHFAANHMRLTVYRNVRRYRTSHRKMFFYVWGVLTYTKPDGSTVEGLCVLWEQHPGHFCVIRKPNASWSEYDEVHDA